MKRDFRDILKEEPRKLFQLRDSREDGSPDSGLVAYMGQEKRADWQPHVFVGDRTTTLDGTVSYETYLIGDSEIVDIENGVIFSQTPFLREIATPSSSNYVYAQLAFNSEKQAADSSD